MFTLGFSEDHGLPIPPGSPPSAYPPSLRPVVQLGGTVTEPGSASQEISAEQAARVVFQQICWCPGHGSPLRHGSHAPRWLHQGASGSLEAGWGQTSAEGQESGIKCSGLAKEAARAARAIGR